MTGKDKITVLVIDDSFFMRKLLTDLLHSNTEIQVVGAASNGKEGLAKIKELKPKVVTLDYEMPGWNGIETLQYIMKEHPVPVVMVSAYTKEDAEITLQALEKGAVEYILKPSGPVSWNIAEVQNEIIKKVRVASLVNIDKFKEFLQKKANKLTFHQGIPGLDKVIVFGASTGGPQTLELILKQFPKEIPATILVVQHMPRVFTKFFAERLNSLCDIQVKEAEQGEVIKKGVAYIAPGGWHMKVKTGVIKLTKDPLIDSFRPSVDVLMQSVAEEYKENTIGVLLTGMGSDGVEGIKSINKMGGETIAQDEETSLIFGMPKRAIESGVVRKVLGVSEIAAYILDLLRN